MICIATATNTFFLFNHPAGFAADPIKGGWMFTVISIFLSISLWKILEPAIREIMEEKYLDYSDIDGMIRWYLDGKTPE